MIKLTHKRLLELLFYNKDTGDFTYNISPKKGPKKNIGDKSGTIVYRGTPGKKKPYVKITIDGKSFLAHRLAYFYVFGKWPEYLIDHEDRNGLNNRWNNLREATNSQNQMNRTGFSKTGLGKGVFPNGKKGKMARIVKDGIPIYLGTYKTEEEAKAVYNKAAEKLFGQFVTLEERHLGSRDLR